VLEYRNTKLAVVEAKAWAKPLTEGVGQAKDYAGKLSIRFTYASNGKGVYGVNMQTGAEDEVVGDTVGGLLAGPLLPRHCH